MIAAKMNGMNLNNFQLKSCYFRHTTTGGEVLDLCRPVLQAKKLMLPEMQNIT